MRPMLQTMVLISLSSTLASGQRPPLRPHAPTPAAPASFLISPMANATKAPVLNFEGGECRMEQTGRTMTCRFHQVLMALDDHDAQTCSITTNTYERTFEKQTETRWIGHTGPTGVCGVLETMTFQRDAGLGFSQWTMDTTRILTNKSAAPSCRTLSETSVDRLSWQNTRRPLPCQFVRAASLSQSLMTARCVSGKSRLWT